MTNKEIMYKAFAEYFSEENTKLKAEIEQLKSTISKMETTTFILIRIDIVLVYSLNDKTGLKRKWLRY